MHFIGYFEKTFWLGLPNQYFISILSLEQYNWQFVVSKSLNKFNFILFLLPAIKAEILKYDRTVSSSDTQVTLDFIKWIYICPSQLHC